MYNIAICDDEIIYSEIIKNILEKELENYDGEYTIRTFGSSDDYLRYLKNEKDSNLLILDVEMPGMGGIELKEYLNNMESPCNIIFVTNHTEAMGDAFGKNVIGFVNKTLLSEKLPVYIKKAVMRKKDDRKFIAAKGSTVKMSDILYIKAEKKYTVIYCKDRECFSDKSITEWESELKGCDFFRCQRSYIINLGFIKMIERGRVEIYGGARIPVSRKLDAELDKIYDEYLIRSI